MEKIENLENIKPNLLQAIYLGFGDTYYHKEQYKEALKYFGKAKELKPTTDSNPISSISIFCLMALCEVNLENCTTAIQYCDSAMSIINENEANISEASRASLKSATNLIAIQVYSKQKDFRSAKILIDQLLANIDAPIYQEPEAYCYRSLFVYYSETSQYNEALKYTELGLQFLRKNNNVLRLPAFIKQKSSLHYAMGNYKSAYNELLQATWIADSIRNSNSAIQLDDLATLYEVSLKDSEIAKAQSQLKFIRTIVVALIGTSIFLLTLVLVVRINSKKQKAKNKVLFKQQEELNKSINYYKKLIVTEVGNNNPNINPLFQQLENYMLEQEPYKIQDINREDIAAALNTNRQYLSSAIKDVTGLTFTNYINKYRL